MSDLNPDLRRLVNLAREARTPGEQDKLRLAERLAIPLAASIAAGTAVGVAEAAAGAKVAGAGAKAAGATLWSGFTAKIAAVVAVGAVGTAVVVGQMEAKPSAIPAVHGNASTTEAAAPRPQPEVAPLQPVVAVPPPQPEPEITAPTAPPKQAAVVQSSKPPDELAQEAALLHQAQSAWRAGQSAQALQLANEHARRFPQSQLANERDVLRVLSLCKLGQVQAAKQVGARLLSKAKGSPWYQSVAGSCAAE